jgi:hypothetical protein
MPLPPEREYVKVKKTLHYSTKKAENPEGEEPKQIRGRGK